MNMCDCVFCKIIKGEIPSYRIYEDEKVYAFLDIAKDAFGHTLVIPKKHCINIFDVSEEDYRAVMMAVKKISEHYKNFGFTGVNIMNASGLDAQQSVFHLHYHIFPRKKDDGLNTWPNFTTKEIDFNEALNLLKIN